MLFERADMLLLLLIAPALFAVGIYGSIKGRRLAQTFADNKIWDRIRPYQSNIRRRLRFLLLLVGVLLIAFSISGPKFGASFEQVKRRGLDVVIAIDTSDSMLAEDVKPNRLDFAKEEVNKILDRLTGDRVALLPFSGDAYLLCPLTLDYSAIRMFLGVVDTDIIPTKGTGLANAINAGLAAFVQSEKQYRVMILLTDGEDLMGQSAEALQKAKEEGVVVFVMGIGTPQGQPIPVKDAGGEVSYKKDRKGQVVISKLNEQNLAKIAKATGGIYVRSAYDDSARDAIFARLDKIERKDQEGKLVTRYKARFQWFLIPGIAFICLGQIVGRRKRSAR